MLSEYYNNPGRLDKISKKGLCWFELKRRGMIQWGNSQQISSGGQKKDESAQLSPGVAEGEDERKVKVNESLVTCEIQKRRRLTRSQLIEEKAGKPAEQTERSLRHKQNKGQSFVDRWSAERYRLAEQNLLEIMKTEGAVFEKPISRHALRSAARKHIGDTGLLDHLLKHIDGKVALGGVERFRRCYNTDGVMEYWLESADLVKIKREAGVTDPNWVPPSWWKTGGVTDETGELKLLKEEMAKMRSDMQEVMSKRKLPDHFDAVEKMQKEFVRWRANTDQRLIAISNSLTSTQDMYKELITWKDKIEQQLLGISNSLNSFQVSKKRTTSGPTPEGWEDWLDSTDLDNLQGDGFESWFGNTNFIDVVPEAVVQDPYSEPPKVIASVLRQKASDNPSQDLIYIGELPLLRDKMAKTKGDLQELLPRKQDEDQANMTPDSSVTANLKSDIENPVIFSQDMLKELITWKAKVEQQLAEVSNAVIALQATK